MRESVRVLVADDQALFRRGLFVVLGSEQGIEVVAEAEDGEEAVAKASSWLPTSPCWMSACRGSTVSRRLGASGSSSRPPRSLMLTVSDEEDDLYEAIKAGANGYLLKEISVEEVAAAIHAVVQGQSLISPSMASKLLSEFNALARQAAEREQLPAPVLTPRELEVLKLVARGMSNKDVADQLFISENTVKNHVRNILEKLHLHSRMEAVMYAVRQRPPGPAPHRQLAGPDPPVYGHPASLGHQLEFSGYGGEHGLIVAVHERRDHHVLDLAGERETLTLLFVQAPVGGPKGVGHW